MMDKLDNDEALKIVLSAFAEYTRKVYGHAPDFEQMKQLRMAFAAGVTFGLMNMVTQIPPPEKSTREEFTKFMIKFSEDMEAWGLNPMGMN